MQTSFDIDHAQIITEYIIRQMDMHDHAHQYAYILSKINLNYDSCQLNNGVDTKLQC